MTENYAQWIAPTSVIASSLETGDIVQITAWGGNEYGYAYTFSLDSTAPANVAIDSDTGRLSFSATQSVGTHTFNIVTTSREAGAVAKYPFTLTVLTGVNGTIGVTSPADTSHIVHFTYDPNSGTWGSPSAGDWTAVLNSMATQIIADQVRCNAVWDESTRMKILLTRGTTYKYTNNKWLDGIQYWNLLDQGAGAKPIMQCTSTDSSPYNSCILNLGGAGGGNIGPGAIGHQIDGIKIKCATIATVPAGSKVVTLLNSGDASKIVVGRWHQVVGSVTQTGSNYPPNVQFIDYVRVAAKSGTTITLDRPLKYGYDQTWYEQIGNTGDADTSLGVARLCPYDTGGAGGYIPTDRRIMQRARMTNVTFADNPNKTAGTLNASLQQIQGAIDWTYENCSIGLPVFSEGAHFQHTGCTVAYTPEWDKLIETIFHINSTENSVLNTGATGVMYILMRNCTMGPISWSPRQLRAINTLFDASTVNTTGTIIAMQAIGGLMYWDFGSAGACQFTPVTGANPWAYAFNTINDAAVLTVGTDASFTGSQLRIPVAFNGAGATQNFQTWLSWAYAGAIVSTNSSPVNGLTTNWGYVQSVTSPGDGTAVWLNIVWVNGTQPTSGSLYLFRRKRLLFASGNTLNSPATWASPGFLKETTASFGTNWDYPSGYPEPVQEEADPITQAQSKTRVTVLVSSGGTVSASAKSLSVSKAEAFSAPLSVGTITLNSVTATFNIFPGPFLLGDRLDADATAAYSLRQLFNTFPGNAVNIRRSSDNATLDIGFTGAGDFNVAAFSQFVGAGTGFITKWYDQSGNNADVSQSNTSLQPRIALNITNGKPVVSITNTSGLGLTSAAQSSNQATISFSSVTSRTGATSSFGTYVSYDGAFPGMTYENSANGGIATGNITSSLISATASDNAFHAAQGIINGASSSITVDNGTPVTGTVTGNTGGTQIDIGARSSQQFVGYIGEILIFNGTALDAHDIALLFSDQKSYYGTP